MEGARAHDVHRPRLPGAAVDGRDDARRLGDPHDVVRPPRLARRTAFRHALSLCEDTEFLFQLAAKRIAVALNPEVLAVYVHHDGQGGEGQKTTLAPEHELSHLRLLADFAGYAPDPWALRESVFRKSRALARALVADGRWYDARPLLWLWLRGAPTARTRCAGGFRSLFARDRRHGRTASASTSTSAAGS